jgi:cytochrome b561
VHSLAFLLLFLTWWAGTAIKTESGPFSASYYVLHIFPASVIFILVLLEWLIRNQDKLVHPLNMPAYLWLNRKLHRAYYVLLMLLPLTGILVFFDWLPIRPFYWIHKTLFNFILGLLVFDLISITLGMLKKWYIDRLDY